MPDPHILLVEASADHAQLIRCWLSELPTPHQVVWVDTLVLGLRCLETVEPDLVIVDLDLPGLHEYQVIRFRDVVQRQHRLPVLALTDQRNPQGQIALNQLEPDQVLIKADDICGMRDLLMDRVRFWTGFAVEVDRATLGRVRAASPGQFSDNDEIMLCQIRKKSKSSHDGKLRMVVPEPDWSA